MMQQGMLHLHQLLLALSLFAPHARGLLQNWTSSNHRYCRGAWVWLPGGRAVGADSWASTARTSSFQEGPCLRVSGIATTVTQNKTVLVIDRSGATNSFIFVKGTRNLAVALELNLETGEQRGLDIVTNAFCSAGQFNSSGTFFGTGGDKGSGYVSAGRGSIRGFEPCSDGNCTFWEAGQLVRGRWYPTSQLLPDGRIAIVGGSAAGAGMNSARINVPTIEYFPRAPGKGQHGVRLLAASLPYNLYPFVHLLPSGRLFLFAGDRWALFDTSNNQELPGSRPQLQRFSADGSRNFWSYPLTGTSALLPLRPTDGYRAEVMLCGGQSTRARNRTGRDYTARASRSCHRIFPEDAAPQWVDGAMRVGRTLGYAVLLPDSYVVLLGGVQQGYGGLSRPGRTSAHQPALCPDMWDSTRQQWHRGRRLACSRVARAYHSSAVLVHDGSVLVSGSNIHTRIVLGQTEFPSEFRSEFFRPPYMRPGLQRPNITQAPDQIALGSNFTLRFSHSSQAEVEVVLAHPGFSTHGSNQGMRNVVLETDRVTQVGSGLYEVEARGPPSANVAPPTWYLLFVVVNRVPSEAESVMVTSSANGI